MNVSTITKENIDIKIANLIPKSIAEKHRIVPIGKENDQLIVAMFDPYNFIAIEDISLYTNLKIKAIRVQDDEIDELLQMCFLNENPIKQGDALSITELIDSIIEEAIEINASDIHIEPTRDNIRIRFRIDGDLHTIRKISSDYSSSIVSRIKVIGNMDIAEKRVSQDGRIEAVIKDNDIDIRLSTMPTVYGEKVVLRLLNKSKFDYKVENLGFNKKNLETFKAIITKPFGMVLVTGPTGCGKSTTMYTVLKEINTEDKNIITVEDPVEYKIHGQIKCQLFILDVLK